MSIDFIKHCPHCSSKEILKEERDDKSVFFKCSNCNTLGTIDYSEEFSLSEKHKLKTFNKTLKHCLY